MTGDATHADHLAERAGSGRAPRDLWKSASAKLSMGSHDAEDLVDDWFRWVGLVSQDATVAAARPSARIRVQTSERGSPPE